MRIKKGIVLQEMGDTFVAYDNDTSTIHELNESAYFIITKIKNGNSKADVIKEIVKEYEVEESKAQSDFDSFLSLLKERRIVF
jgi:hypothetical protein